MNTNQKINQIRELMKEKKIDAYIVTNNDPHQSEYVSEHWKARQWVSGFTGSVGTLVITMDESGIWTDGRYFIQAENQLKGSAIKLFKQGEKGVPTYIDWLLSMLGEGDTLGFNGKVFSRSFAKSLESNFIKRKVKINKDYDLVDLIWKARPMESYNSIYHHEIKYSGLTTAAKIEMVRDEMKQVNADMYILSSLDDIAWLFNIRGSDIPYNPVAMGHGVITHQKASLFINKGYMKDCVIENLKYSLVDIYGYDYVNDWIKGNTQGSVYLDPNKITTELFSAIPEQCEIIEGMNITTKLKAIKNAIELENLVNCQIKDGTAMVKFIYWLENNIGKETITELSVSDKLEEFRKEQSDFKSPSFDTIAGYKDHAAMMHYKADFDNQYTLEEEGFLLIDSGGQYLDGTTDITRTIPLGKISRQEREDYTLVLKGLISLCRVKFLYGATGSNLDIMARYPLWQKGIDYKCGTGHGIGYFLNVHEGPQNFSQVPNTVKLEENMIITVEPGIYREGSHGIRIENTVAVTRDEKTEFGQFMRFNTISYCPISLEAVDISMLEPEEIKWLNDYHQEVYVKLAPHLTEELQKWYKEYYLIA